MTGLLSDDYEDICDTDIKKNDFFCGHGAVWGGFIDANGHSEGSCDGIEFDVVWKEKGVLEVTCKKCGTAYRLTPYMWAAEPIKKSKKKVTQ